MRIACVCVKSEWMCESYRMACIWCYYFSHVPRKLARCNICAEINLRFILIYVDICIDVWIWLWQQTVCKNFLLFATFHSVNLIYNHWILGALGDFNSIWRTHRNRIIFGMFLVKWNAFRNGWRTTLIDLEMIGSTKIRAQFTPFICLIDWLIDHLGWVIECSYEPFNELIFMHYHCIYATIMVLTPSYTLCFWQTEEVSMKNELN